MWLKLACYSATISHVLLHAPKLWFSVFIGFSKSLKVLNSYRVASGFDFQLPSVAFFGPPGSSTDVLIVLLPATDSDDSSSVQPRLVRTSVSTTTARHLEILTKSGQFFVCLSEGDSESPHRLKNLISISRRFFFKCQATKKMLIQHLFAKIIVSPSSRFYYSSSFESSIESLWRNWLKSKPA